MLVSSLSFNKKGPRPIIPGKRDTRNETHAYSINLFIFLWQLISSYQQHKSTETKTPKKKRDFLSSHAHWERLFQRRLRLIHLSTMLPAFDFQILLDRHTHKRYTNFFFKPTKNNLTWKRIQTISKRNGKQMFFFFLYQEKKKPKRW